MLAAAVRARSSFTGRDVAPSEAVIALAARGRAPNTWNLYTSTLIQWELYATRVGSPFLPADPTHFANFLAEAAVGKHAHTQTKPRSCASRPPPYPQGHAGSGAADLQLRAACSRRTALPSSRTGQRPASPGPRRRRGPPVRPKTGPGRTLRGHARSGRAPLRRYCRGADRGRRRPPRAGRPVDLRI